MNDDHYERFLKRLDEEEALLEHRYYSARQLPDGRCIILKPDGLAWEAERPTLESAQAHALSLNEWVDSKPTDQIIPFFNPEILSPEPSVDRLFAIIDRLYEADKKFDALSKVLAASVGKEVYGKFDRQVH